MPGGQPTKYNPEISQTICNYIMAGLTLRQIAEKPGTPTIRTIFNWLLKYDEFFHQHARARSVQAWGEVDDMLKLADTCELKSADINKARLQIDVRKFRAERFNRAAFGDKREVKHTGNIAMVSIPLDALKGQQNVIDAEIIEEGSLATETQEPKQVGSGHTTSSGVSRDNQAKQLTS